MVETYPRLFEPEHNQLLAKIRDEYSQLVNQLIPKQP